MPCAPELQEPPDELRANVSRALRVRGPELRLPSLRRVPHLLLVTIRTWLSVAPTRHAPQWYQWRPHWRSYLSACRVGEASHPGPSSSHGHDDDESALQNDGPSSSQAEEASGSDAHQSLGSSGGSQTTGSARSGGPPNPLPGGLMLYAKNGEHGRLKCRWLPGTGVWRWAFPGSTRLTADSRTSAYEGLTRFFDHHADFFTDESKEEIIYALTLVRLPDSAQFSTPPHVHGADDVRRDHDERPALDPSLSTPDATLTPHDEAGFRQIPTADEAAAFLETATLASLVHPGRRCQRQVPKSCIDLVGKTLLDLSTLAQDLRLAAPQRELAWIMFFLAPTLLWPEPSKQEGGRPPQARPQLVKQCVQHVRNGQWIDLINGLPKPPARTPVEPTAPGVVTPSSARAWMGEASRGRAAQAWRRLHSWGIASSTPDTLAQVEAKWAIQPQHSLPAWQVPRLELLEMMIAPPRLAKALRHFQKSKASDAHGWAPSAFKQLLGQSQARKALLAAVKAMWLNELSGLSLALSSISRSFPLRKNEQGQVRPIAMPTMFRKLQATLTSLHFSTAIQEFTGAYQYGTQRNGCARFGRWVNTYKLRFPEHVCVQMDLQDAFCSADRRVLLRTMADMSPDLAGACSSWLATPSFTVIEGEMEQPAIYQTTRGIAQGDPLSTMGFCMLMASARKEWMRTAANTSQWGAYIDDTVLIVDPAHLDESWTSASAVLAAHGLQINARKTRIWAQPEQIAASWHGCIQPSGLKLCGLPVWEDSATGVHMDATPVGGEKFLTDFMHAHCQDFAKRLSTLQALVQHLGPNSGALHASLRVLRTSMLQRHQHILRTRPVERHAAMDGAIGQDDP